ncbi:Chemotaxis protein CheD [Brevinematales bacterium NS]|nr:chemotaxis protein CheD [Brevinematales bacterium]QJR23137.1 Chemotaxis protein CheD [Brevinematales bacterium NS]
MNTEKEYFLNPGELIFSKKPIVVKTVLGSCVSVTIYDKTHQWGGMCHYLLPVAPSEEHHSTKYGNIAIYTLLKKFLKDHGSQREDLVATIIGGAFIIFDEREIFFIGDRNIDVAMEILRKEKIYIKQMHTGGEHGRRVWYHTGTNKIVIETLDKMTVEDLYKP